MGITILPEEEDLLFLTNAFQIHAPVFAPIISEDDDNIIMQIPSDATRSLITKAFNGSPPASTLAQGSTLSLSESVDDSAYQVTTTGQLRLVVRMQAGANDRKFKIWKSTSADSATGTTVFDFTGARWDNTNYYTTPILEFAVTANDYINIENTSTGAGNLTNAVAWIVEHP